MNNFNPAEDLISNPIDPQQVVDADFAATLRSICAIFLNIEPKIVPSINVTLAYRPRELQQALQLLAMLAAEYGLYHEDVRYSETAITVRLKRV